MKDRDLSLDIIRIIACSLVVLMHSPIPSGNANGPFLVALSYFTAPCIGLFFMVSGALLLPVKTDYFTFIKKRLSKIIIPTLIWTTIYLVLNIYFSQSEINILKSLLSVPFSAQGNGVLWFMYTLIGLYLIAPILSTWVAKASDKEIRFILLLWGVTLCFPLLKTWLNINTSTTGILYYFTGYAGYFLLGHALKYGRIKPSFPLVLIISSIGLATLLLIKLGLKFDFYSLFWYESIFIAALCCLYWKCLIVITHNLSSFISKERTRLITIISNVSFGIYLIHILIMRDWFWKLSFITSISNYFLQTFVIAISTIVISIIICVILSRLNVGQWIIGYSSKNK